MTSQSGFGSLVLGAACRLLAPFMVLFAVYVVVHGHDSPGGGFQGGVILAAALIFIRLVRGQRIPFGTSRPRFLSVLCAGPIIYIGVGILAVLSGGNFLDYGALPLGLFIEAPSQIRAVGTLVIEVGITLGVAGAVLLIFEALSSVGPEDDASMEDA